MVLNALDERLEEPCPDYRVRVALKAYPVLLDWLFSSGIDRCEDLINGNIGEGILSAAGNILTGAIL